MVINNNEFVEVGFGDFGLYQPPILLVAESGCIAIIYSSEQIT